MRVSTETTLVLDDDERFELDALTTHGLLPVVIRVERVTYRSGSNRVVVRGSKRTKAGWAVQWTVARIEGEEALAGLPAPVRQALGLP